MDHSLTPAQNEIREAVGKICARFGDDYWLARDTDGAFPRDFHKALADAGWLGIAMPEAYGGAGLGITEAAVQNKQLAQRNAVTRGFAGFPVWANGARGGSLRSDTPQLGEHSREILVELGFDDAEIADFLKSRAVGAA